MNLDDVKYIYLPLYSTDSTDSIGHIGSCPNLGISFRAQYSPQGSD